MRLFFAEPGIHKFPYESKCCRGGSEASNISEESMNHAFPYIEASINSRCHRTFNEANRIIQKYLVVADMDADRY
jgi:hypothetical protein